MNNNVGLHIRLSTNLSDVIKKAIRLNLPYFQTFLTFANGEHINLEKKDVDEFLNLRRKNFKNTYLHGSYWINLCNSQRYGYKVLEREVHMAKELEFTHIILHPGSAKTCLTKSEGIDFLAKSINKILKKEQDINIVFENTAHGKMSVGSDINDYEELFSKINNHERTSFCIDTAHAYSFGYDLSNKTGQEDFLNLINKNIGFEKISLIHLNDTSEKLGKCIDKHDIPGQGNIGKNALIEFLNNENLKNIPRILELPVLKEDEEIKVFEEIKKW